MSTTPHFNHEAYLWNQYLKNLIKPLQTAARQKVFRFGKKVRQCCLCETTVSVQALIEDYRDPLPCRYACVPHHRELKKNESLFDLCARHDLKPISWEDWKNGKRPTAKKAKAKK